MLPQKLFITGTNTDIGKTVTAAVLMAGLRGKYYKPIQSGLAEITDTEWVQDKTDLAASHFFPETYRLVEPLSPHASAALEGIEISLEAFQLPHVAKDDQLIVEGAGGILVPLNDQHFMLDLIVQFNIPVLLVADSQLGTINHTLLSIRQLRQADVPILGIVMNGEKNPGNRQAIEQYGQVNVVAEIEPIPNITAESLKDCFNRQFSHL